MQINREKLNKVRQFGQTRLNRIKVELTDWLKLSRVFLGLSRKLGTVKGAILLSTQLETHRVRMRALRRLGRLNAQADLDQLCAVWYDTRNPMLGNLITQKEWVASQPLPVKVLSGLQAGQTAKLDKTDVRVLAELIRLGQAETDLRLARLAADQLNGVQDESVLEALLADWIQLDRAPLFTLEEVTLLAVIFTAGFRVMVVLKLGRLELLTAGGPEIIEPLLAVYTGEDQALSEAARQVLVQLDHPATREKLCELALSPNQPIVRQLVLQAGYYPQEPHQRALFFFLTGQWEKYESLDFDYSLLKFRYEAADSELRKRIGETARLNGRAEIATMLVSNSGRGLTQQRLRSMSHEEWQLVVNLLLEGERWEEAWELVGSAPAIFSYQILKRLTEAKWEPARPEAALTFTDLVIKANECNTAYPPLGRQLKADTKLNLTAGQLNDIVISPDGKYVASASQDGTIQLWSLPDGQMITMLHDELCSPDERRKIPADLYQVRNLVFSPNGQTLAFEDTWSANKRQGRWRLLDINTGIITHTLEHNIPHELASKLAFSANGELVAIIMADGINIREIASNKLMLQLKDVRARNIKNLIFSPDGKKLAVEVMNDWGNRRQPGGVHIWNLSDQSSTQSLRMYQPLAEKPFKFEEDKRTLLVFDRNANIHFWDLAEYSVIGILHGHFNPAGTMTISQDRQRLATGHRGAIRLWNLPEHRPVKTVERLGQELVTNLVFSPDDQFLISATKSGKVTVWTTRLAKLARINIEQIEPDDLHFTHRAQHDPALPAEERHWLQFVESLLGWQLRHLIESGETLSGEKWVASVETLLGWQLLHEVELDEAPSIKVGDFDIEIDSI